MIVLLLKLIRWLLTILLYVVVGSEKQRSWGFFRSLGRSIARISRAAPGFWRILGSLLAALIVLTLLFAVWQPFFWELLGKSAPSTQVSAETLAPIMALVVALLSLGIAGFGWFTYQLLRGSIEEVARREGQRQRYTIFDRLQYSCWLMYKPHLPKARDEPMSSEWVGLVDAATEMARMALTLATSEYGEVTILATSNSLAYHIATKRERASKEERNEATRLAYRIFKEAEKHDRYEWRETYVWVLWRLASDTPSKNEARRVLDELILSAQVPEEQKVEWQDKYKRLLG